MTPYKLQKYSIAEKLHLIALVVGVGEQTHCIWCVLKVHIKELVPKAVVKDSVLRQHSLIFLLLL